MLYLLYLQLIITLQYYESLHMSLKSVNRQRIVYEQKFNHKNDSYYQSYEIGKQLGKGGFAQVYEVFKTNEISPHLKAVKVLTLKDDKSNYKEKIQTEIKLMQLASQNSDSFVKYYHSFTYSDKIYIIMELCQWGSMGDVLKKRKNLTEPEVRFFIQQLVQILLQLKKKGIVHRDIKPANVLIASNFKFKLADFGLAISHQEISKVKTMCGTPNYLAPEVINKKGYSYEVDLWAMGVMMFTLLYGVAPFQTKTINQTYQRIKKCSFKFEGPNKSLRISQEAKSLLKEILKVQPSQRIKLQQIPKHPFLCSYQIPRRLEKENTQVPPPVQFVKKYMKKISPKNDRKPVQFSQNNSETTLEKKEHPGPKITYRNCLPKSAEKEKSTNEYRFPQNKVKIQQFVDLELSKVQTSTSVKKRQRSPAGYGPTPKKMFRNNNYVKNQVKIEEPVRIDKIIEVKREQPEVIVKQQEILQHKNKIQEPSRLLKLKWAIKNTNLSFLLNDKKNRESLSSNIEIPKQFLSKNRQKQEQRRFCKERVATVIWQKIMQNGDFLYSLSNQQHGILFKDKTQAITKDFQAIKFNRNPLQGENDPKDYILLEFKKTQFKQYRKDFPLKPRVKIQPLGVDDPISYLTDFASVSNGRFFIFDQGILQFRHKNGWYLTYIRGETCFIYQDKLQTECIEINGSNLNLFSKQVYSRFLEFVQTTNVLDDLHWAYNGLQLKEEQLQKTAMQTSKLEVRVLSRLVV